MNNYFSVIIEKIQSGEDMAPFLFVGENLELLNLQVEELALSVLKNFSIPKVYLYTLKDNGENLKIQQIKEFVNNSNSKAPYKFQIFLFENISRLTLASANSLLKFFEEPGVQNIIFLTNTSENNVLDTILSRVQVINIGGNFPRTENAFYKSIIKSYFNNESDEIISYFYKNKLEKTEYIEFLETLLAYLTQNFLQIDDLEELNEDINLAKQNNLNAKYLVDKWILRVVRPLRYK